MKQNQQKGFTLIELLVVIAIIGLLASIILLALNSARAKSRDAKRLAEARSLASAQEAYYDSQIPSSYATDISSLVTGGYMQTTPSYPQPVDGDCGQTDYGVSGNETSFVVTFCLGNGNGNVSGGTHTFSQNGLE